MSNKQTKKTSILAVLSFIFAFLYIPFFFLSGNALGNSVLFLFPILPLILGITALFQIKRNSSLKGMGWAIAGIITIVILFSLICYFAILFFPC